MLFNNFIMLMAAGLAIAAPAAEPQMPSFSLGVPPTGTHSSRGPRHVTHLFAVAMDSPTFTGVKPTGTRTRGPRPTGTGFPSGTRTRTRGPRPTGTFTGTLNFPPPSATAVIEVEE